MQEWPTYLNRFMLLAQASYVGLGLGMRLLLIEKEYFDPNFIEQQK